MAWARHTLHWALCQCPVMAGHKARFISAADLMMQWAAAKAQGRLREYFNRAVLGPQLLVIDKIGYLPFARDEAKRPVCRHRSAAVPRSGRRTAARSVRPAGPCRPPYSARWP